MNHQGYTYTQLIAVARSLEPVHGTEYHRAICELIGRLMYDVSGVGESTGDNAALVAAQLRLPVRYTVDGRESDDPEANDEGDGQFPPFQVFNTDAQRHVPILYQTRAEAQVVCDGLNAAWRAKL